MHTNYEAVIFAGMLCPGKKKQQAGINHQDIQAEINI